MRIAKGTSSLVASAMVVALGACSSRASTPASSTAPAPLAPTATTAVSAPSPSSTTPAERGPCGQAIAQPPQYSHVVWIWMENHSYHQVLGSTSAPYETQLANGCATMSRYHSVGTPSLPNYLGATSGSTWGISDDADPGTHPLAVDNLFRQVRASGGAERSYEEDMPTACVLTSSGEYEVKHNPAAYYNGAGDRSACKVDDLPLGSPDSGPLARELSAGGLPTFAFITPNLCNDTHDCGVSAGDAWLARWVPRILGSPDYRAGGTALFVVWDEDSPMPNIVVSPSTHPGTVSAASFDHYSLLRTAEEMLGLPLIGAASGANSMRSAFNL